MSDFQAGAATRDIMPTPEMVNNSLHACMTVRVHETGSPLRVKALALRRGRLTVLIAQLDLISVSRQQAEAMRRRIAEATGIDAERIVICASHTHSSPRMEPLEGPHPFFDFVAGRLLEAAKAAVASLQPARIAHGTTYAVGASFNTRYPMPDGSVKYTRDFREGLSSGKVIDPRLTVLRVDDLGGRPIAGWVWFAAHPACVIFDAPISAEYPGYMADRLSETVAGGAPVLFGYGDSGDVNCIPMFGQESDSRHVGLQLAALAGSLFDSLRTRPPERLAWHAGEAELPMDLPPSIQSLDADIAAVEAFTLALDRDPSLEWVLGINCKKDWPAEKKKAHVAGLAQWARLMKQALAAGRTFPGSWRVPLASLVIDDLGIVFYGGEALTRIGLKLAAESPLRQTLLTTICNGNDAYIGLAEDRRAGGYETYTSVRYFLLAEGVRPLPYAPEAGDRLVEACLASLASAAD